MNRAPACSPDYDGVPKCPLRVCVTGSAAPHCPITGIDRRKPHTQPCIWGAEERVGGGGAKRCQLMEALPLQAQTCIQQHTQRRNSQGTHTTRLLQQQLQQLSVCREPGQVRFCSPYLFLTTSIIPSPPPVVSQMLKEHAKLSSACWFLWIPFPMYRRLGFCYKNQMPKTWALTLGTDLDL